MEFTKLCMGSVLLKIAKNALGNHFFVQGQIIFLVTFMVNE